MKTLVLGVGAFGVAILKHLSSLHKDETLYAYEKDPTVLTHLIRERKSPYFFTDFTFPANVIFLEKIEDVLPTIDCIVLIIPNQFIRSALAGMKPYIKSGVTFLNLSKGIDNTTLRTVSDTIADELGDFPYHYACLSWGMIAGELVAWNPLGADIGVSDSSIGVPLTALFASENLSIRITEDYKNTELYGALKNIFALYVGYLEGKWYGASTVGYHYCLLWEDMKQLIPLLGGNPVLDYGDFALGWDMIATCFGNSRNKHFGKLVGSGKTPTEAYNQLKEEKKHAEWYETLKGVKAFIEGKGKFEELEKVLALFLP